MLIPKLLGWFVQSKAAKSGMLLGGSSGMVALMISLFGHVDSKALETESQVRQYVDTKHELVMSEVSNINKGVDDIKSMLKTIDNRLYDLKKEN